MSTEENYQVDLEEVVKKYGSMIRRVAALNTSSLQDAEDVYQEVFVDLMRRFSCL